MAHVVEQSNSGDTGTGTPTTVDATLGSDTTAGNKVIIVVSCDATVSTPTDFTLDRSQVSNNGHYVFSKTAVAETASWTLTPSSGASMAWVAYEISGLTTDAADQVQSTGTGSSVTQISTGTTGTTSQADELIVGTVGQSKNYTGGAVVDMDSWTNSFVQQDWDASVKTANTNVGVAVAFLTATSTGTFETTAAWSGVAHAATAIIATYRIAGGVDDEAVLTAHPVTASFPATTTVNNVNATATATALLVAGSFPVAVADGGTVETVIRPIADTAGTGWDSAPTASQALWSQVDEATASDTDYIYTTDPNP